MKLSQRPMTQDNYIYFQLMYINIYCEKYDIKNCWRQFLLTRICMTSVKLIVLNKLLERLNSNEEVRKIDFRYSFQKTKVDSYYFKI